MVGKDTQVSFQSKSVAADFLSHSYRISGQVSTQFKPLADSLNDPSTDFLEVDTVYISPMDNPAAITGNYTAGSLRKDNISLVVVTREEDGLSTSSSYGSYVGHVLRPVFITVPGFEIRGMLELQHQANLRTFMVNAERFIPIVDGTATVSAKPDVTFQGGVLLVRKESIGIFCLTKEE